MKTRRVTRAAWIRVGIIAGGMLITLTVVWAIALRMPGSSYHGPSQPLDAHELAVRDELQRDVQVLAGDIGERNYLRSGALAQASAHLQQSFAAAGYTVDVQRFEWERQSFENLSVELRGTTRPDEIVVVGAHYDTAVGTPGANDNGSGVAAMLSLARTLGGKRSGRTVRFVAFVNEEPPYYYSDGMGSVRYARRCRERGDNVVAMMSLETMGYFSSEPDSQAYPAPGLGLVYPTTGDFISVVGDLSSRALVRDIIRVFRQNAKVPSEASALPGKIPGVGWSDHWSFWQSGYPAVMVTDTAPFRYKHYHKPEDTPDKVKYDDLARVVVGLESVLSSLADHGTNH